ncbi:MAG: peptidoglycan-binding protein, partial [Sarcina sp.]
FALHGFEDNWRHDGEALVKIATELVYKFSNYNGSNGLHGWTVYIAQCMNPDGVVEGRTNNGPGRCAVTTKIDMNRCFPYGFIQRTNSREYTGPTPLGAPEAVALKNFVQGLNGQASEMVVLDFHGWMTFSQGNAEIGRYFGNQFGFGNNSWYADGFFTSWASTLKNTKATLIEYPKSTRSYQDVLNGNYIGKTFNAMINIMKNNPGSGSGGDGGSGNGDYDNNSEYHRILKVTTPLMRGDDVKKVQKKLNDLGYNAGTVDGIYGYGTEAAVIRFQKDKTLLVDGRVGADTWNKLIDSSSSGNLGEYDNNSEYHRVLKLTNPLMRGEDVKKVQNRLNNLGYDIGLVNGAYDDRTKAEVSEFQDNTGLVVDGVVGEKTWNRLLGWIAPEVYPDNIAVVISKNKYQVTYSDNQCKNINSMNFWIKNYEPFYSYGTINGKVKTIINGQVCYVPEGSIEKVETVYLDSAAEVVSNSILEEFKSSTMLTESEVWTLTYTVCKGMQDYKEFNKLDKKVIKLGKNLYMESRSNSGIKVRVRLSEIEAQQFSVSANLKKIKFADISKGLVSFGNIVGIGLTGFESARDYAQEKEARGEEVDWKEVMARFLGGVSTGVILAISAELLAQGITALLAGLGISAGAIFAALIAGFIIMIIGKLVGSSVNEMFSKIIGEVLNRISSLGTKEIILN